MKNNTHKVLALKYRPNNFSELIGQEIMVETVTNSIKRHILNKSFKSIHLNWQKTLENFTVDEFNAKTKNKPIADVYRRGKYIVIAFNDCILAVHLRMTGKLYVVEELDVNKKHISVYLKFSNKYLR